MNQRIPFYSLLILLAIILAGCGAQSSAGSTPTPVPAPTTVAKPIYTVQRGEVVSQIDFRGQVSAAKEQLLYFKSVGRVKEILVEAGQVITAGQVVATLDVTDAEQERASLQAELDLLENDYSLALHKAELTLQIAQMTLKLYQQENRSELEIRIQKLQVELAQIELNEIQINPDIQSKQERIAQLGEIIARSVLISPIDSTVLTLLVVQGRSVDPDTPVASLGDPNQLEIRSEIGNDELKIMREGMLAQVWSDKDPEQVITGTIRLLPPPYGTSPDDRVHISLNENARPSEVGFQLNYLVNVRVLLERHTGVLWLPPEAITRIGGRSFVYLQEGDIQRRQDVKLGLVSIERVEIVEGLIEGQKVIGP